MSGMNASQASESGIIDNTYCRVDVQLPRIVAGVDGGSWWEIDPMQDGGVPRTCTRYS